MFRDMDRSGRRTLLFFVLLIVNTVGGLIGGLGIAYTSKLNTTDHQTMGLIFCFVSALILLTSAFVVILQRERERNEDETFAV